jgi:hypothetical protein
MTAVAGRTAAIAADPTTLPRIYLASPLTNLNKEMRRSLGCEVQVVKQTIEKVTVADRAEGDSWPVAIYAPFDKTAPWNGDGLSPAEVYLHNLTEILNSDALIVVADRAASAGVGQETEWAARLGLPILYLSSAESISRQIQGTPAAITAIACNGDSDKLTEHVTAFLRQWRLRIQDGPRRRDSRRLRLQPLTSKLSEKWNAVSDRTGVAARCDLDIRMIELALADPARLGMLSADAIFMLCAELGVALGTPAAQLSVPAIRALVLAAEHERWPDSTVEELRLRGLATTAVDPGLDLATLDGWRTLFARIPSAC